MGKPKKGKLAALLQVASHVTAPKAKPSAGHKRPRQQQAQAQSAPHQHQHVPADLQLDIPPAAGTDAYQQLMGILTKSKSKASQALRHRRLEEQGDSGLSSSEPEDEQLSDDDMPGSEDDPRSDTDAPPAIKKRAMDHQNGTVTASKGADDEEGDGEDEEGSDSAEEEANAAGSGRQQNGQVGLAAVPDTWAAHVNHVMSEAEAAGLQGASRIKWSEVAPAGKEQRGLVLPGKVWQTAGAAALPATHQTLDGFSVKERLITRWREVHEEDARQEDTGGTSEEPAAEPAKQHRTHRRAANGQHSTQHQRQGAGGGGCQQGGGVGAGGGGDWESADQGAFFACLQSYADVTWACRPYPGKLDAPDPLQDAYLLHCLNHIVKTADTIKKNNERLESARQQAGKGEGGAGTGEAPDIPRDQGFTRPKVLILLPQRNLAFRCVLRLVRLAMRETRADSVTGKARFVEQFTDPEEVPEEELEAGALARRLAKPAEWRALMGSGNTDDHFRLGLKITRGAIRLFSNLFESDIIIASPLALATKLAEDAQKRDAAAAAAGSSKAQSKAKAEGSQGDGAADFLSSIEVVIMDRADVMAMQNWSHLESVLAALNQLPREQHGVDIMRVREWALAGWAKHYRQTVLLSSFLTPSMNALMGSLAVSNYRGRIRLQPAHQGVLQHVIPQVQQIFERFPCASPADSGDARFSHFTQVVWPRLKECAALSTGGLLVFIPSYFDFVRVRNFLKAEDNDLFESISEYTAGPDVTAARNRFYQRRARVLLYSERAHFYHRHRIRGITDVLFYGPPDHAHYYTELVNLLESSGGAHGSVGLLYCKWDVLSLERLVGASRASKMIKGDTTTFMFC